MKRRADSTTLEDKVTVDVQEAEKAIQALVSDLSTLKSALNGVSNSTGISDVESQLKNLEKELKACGNYDMAKAVKEYSQELHSSVSDTNSQIEKLKTSIEATFGTEELEKFNSTLESTNTKSEKVLSTLTKIKDAINFKYIFTMIKKIFNVFSELNEAGTNYIETLNLFSVSFGAEVDGLNEYYERALEFQDELADKLGVTKAESMEYQATFNSMAKSMGVNADAAYTLSENLTKLTYDLSSLYNIDTETAYSKLSSGVISGQSKSLRTLGIDVTDDTIQQTLDKLDIDVDYSSLSQAEKVVARYISVLEQATIAEGDLARTMESPANQLRILDAQITQFKVNISNLWQGFLGGILPYINAVMMVVNELLEMTAELFGFEYTGVSGTSSYVDDLTDSVNEATESVQELKNQLMGFDEINNITINDSSDSGTTTSTGTGINQALLDALEGYDNLMDSVSNKATEIKEKIMDWLGFTGDEVEDMERLQEIMEKIKTAVKIIGILFLTWKIVNFLGDIGSLITKLSGFSKLFGSSSSGLSSVLGTATSASSTIKEFKLPNVSTILTGLADLALIVGGVTALVVVIGAFMQIPRS